MKTALHMLGAAWCLAAMGCGTPATSPAPEAADDYHVTGNCAMTFSEEDLALRAAKHAEEGVTMVTLSNGYEVFTQQFGASDDDDRDDLPPSALGEDENDTSADSAGSAEVVSLDSFRKSPS